MPRKKAIDDAKEPFNKFRYSLPSTHTWKNWTKFVNMHVVARTGHTAQRIQLSRCTIYIIGINDYYCFDLVFTIVIHFIVSWVFFLLLCYFDNLFRFWICLFYWFIGIQMCRVCILIIISSYPQELV